MKALVLESARDKVLVEVALPRTLASIPLARDIARDELPPSSEERSADILLVLSEMITNAVRHGQGERFGLALARTPIGVHAEVSDAGPGFSATPHCPPPMSTGGRGLLIIDTIALTWGSLSTPDGTTVWASLPL